MFRLKHSFTSGEISPLMYDRVDFDRHKNGCKTLKNMQVLSQGPAIRRPGTEYIATYNLASSSLLRLVPFVVSSTESFVLFFHTNDGIAHTDISIYSSYGNLITTLSLTFILDKDFDYTQSANEMYVTSGTHKPLVIKRDVGTGTWSVTDMPDADFPPSNEWSNTNGWPEVCSFFQQRLVFAATTLYKDTIWLSKAGSFYDFDWTNIPTDDTAKIHPVRLTLASGRYNKIQWLDNGRSLMVGTTGDEWTVAGTLASANGAIAAGAAIALRHTTRGSKRIKPIHVNFSTLFVERFGMKVNEFVYDYTNEGYKTSDLSVLSPHLTRKWDIKDWAYQQVPHNIIWCVRGDGDLIAITYQREHKVVGWHQHSTGDLTTTVNHKFKAICSVPGNYSHDEVFVLTTRTGVPFRYYLEKFSTEFVAEEGDNTTCSKATYLDSHVTDYSYTATVNGLTHLIGQNVQALCDGQVIDNITINSDSYTFDTSYTYKCIGLPYISELEPVLPEVSMQDGTSLGRMQRITDLNIDFYETLGGYVGSYDDEGNEHVEEIPYRRNFHDMSRGLPPFTGYAHWAFSEGFNRTPGYFIRQTDPLPMTIRSFTESIEVRK